MVHNIPDNELITGITLLFFTYMYIFLKLNHILNKQFQELE